MREALGKINWKSIIGEVALIFLGITLAIWFDNWNEGIADSHDKLIYIQSLKEDLQDDIEEYESLISWNDNRIKRIYELNRAINQ